MKSKTNLSFLVMFVLGAFACSNSSPQGDGSVVEIMVGGKKVSVLLLNKVKSGTATIPLSSLLEDFEIVQLEMHEDAVFNPVSHFLVTEKYLGVRTYDDNYKLFDRTGKFLCTVGRRGRGPGEYPNSISDDIIDEKNGLIYLSCFSGKILVYSISGGFLKEFIAPQLMYNSKMFMSDGILSVVHAPKILVLPNRTIHQADVMIVKYDANKGELMEKIAPPFEHLISRTNGENIFSLQNVQGVFDFFPDYFQQEQYDTLYHIDLKMNRLFPFFTVEYNFIKARDKPIIFQLNKNLMMTILKETTPAGYYVERDVIATDLRNKTSSRVKVINDYLGNMDVSNAIQRSFRKGYLVRCIQPEDLMEDIEKRLTESNCTENDRKILQKTLSTLKENENNVVFIGKLKSEVKSKLW